MGKSQSKASGKAEKKEKREKKGRTDDTPDGNPDDVTATPTFDRPARVHTLTSPTKNRPKANSARRPPSRSGRVSTIARDAYRDQPDEARHVEDGKPVANGPNVIENQRAAHDVKSQNVVMIQEKKAPGPSVKPKPSAKEKGGEKDENVENAFDSPRTTTRRDVTTDPGMDQKSVSTEANADAGGKSPVFVPDVSDSPRTPRLPRVTLTVSPASSPRGDRKPCNRSQSEPDRPKSPRPTLEKNVSVETSTQSLQTGITFFESGRRTPTGNRSGSTSPERNSASPAVTPKNTQKTATGSNLPSGRSTPVLPRLAFDHVTVSNIVDNNKHNRAMSERRSFDAAFLSRPQTHQRRSSFDEHFHGKLNALLAPQASTSHDQQRRDGDFPSPNPKRFHTPQPQRRGTGPTIQTEL